jgi:hypothetical protein
MLNGPAWSCIGDPISSVSPLLLGSSGSRALRAEMALTCSPLEPVRLIGARFSTGRRPASLRCMSGWMVLSRSFWSKVSSSSLVSS